MNDLDFERDDFDTDVVPVDPPILCGTCIMLACGIPDVPREIPKVPEHASEGMTVDDILDVSNEPCRCRVPVVGDRVLFVLPNGPCRGQMRPAVVAQENEDLMRPTLVVFTLGDDGAQFRDGCVEIRPTGWSPNAEPGTWHRASDRRMRFEFVDVDPATFRVR